MARQDQRREETRAKLLSTARDLFLIRGFGATTTQMILKETGLSKGAMYHHFESKADLFEALFIETSRTAIDSAVASLDPMQSPFARFKASTFTWLAEIRKPDVAKIMLQLGPEALGWKRAKAIEDDHSLPMMRAGLEAAQNAGEINVPSVEMTARFINATLAEAAFVYCEEGEAAWPDIVESLEQMFAGMERS